jgi:hypothetical protein
MYKFALKFAISESSKLDLPVLVDNSASQLMYKTYRILERTDVLVSFIDDLWQFRLRNTFGGRMDEGQFAFKESNGETMVTLTYYLFILPEVLITAAVIAFYYFTNSTPILFLFVLPFWIQLIINIYRVKERSKELMMKITPTR